MKYAHLSNHDLIALLETSRLMHHTNVPEQFNAIAHPTGHDLLEVVKERLQLGAGSIMNDVDANTKIDLDYLFTHNHDIRDYIEKAIDAALDHRNGRLQRPVEELLLDIMSIIKNYNLVARSANEVFVLYVGYDLSHLDFPEQLEFTGQFHDFIIAKVK